MRTGLLRHRRQKRRASCRYLLTSAFPTEMPPLKIEPHVGSASNDPESNPHLKFVPRAHLGAMS
jgi:hypothetical protein